MTASRLAGLGLCLTMAASACAQVTQAPGGYLFRLKLSKGEKLKFSIPFTIEGLQEKPMQLKFGMKLTVLKLDRDGNATVKVGSLSGAQKYPNLSRMGGSFVVDRLGHVQGAGSTLAGFCIRYSKSPVPVGGHFLAAVPTMAGSSLDAGVTDAQATFTFVGLVGSGTKRQARLNFKVAGNRAPAGSILVRLTDGVIDKYYTRFYISLPGSQSTDKPYVVTATVQRQ